MLAREYWGRVRPKPELLKLRSVESVKRASEAEGTVEKIGEICSRVVAAMRGRYVRGLEDEVARLRAENRVLLNSLLGTAGLPPLGPEAPRGPMVSSVRRRSWPQIAADLELQEMQKPRTTETQSKATRRTEKAVA